MHAKQEPKFRFSWWIVAFAVAGILLLGVILFRPAPSGAGQEDGSSLSTSSDATNNPSTGPTPTVPPVITEDTENTEPDVPTIPTDDCRQTMTDAQYVSFIERLIAYERLQVLPETSQKQKQLIPYVTQRYLDDHGGDIDEANLVVVKIDSLTTRCQVKTNGSIVGVIVPVISIYEPDGAAKNLGVIAPVHYTSWIKIQGVWYVNQEQD